MTNPGLSPPGAELVRALGAHGLSGREIAELLWLATTIHEKTTKPIPSTGGPRWPESGPDQPTVLEPPTITDAIDSWPPGADPNPPRPPFTPPVVSPPPPPPAPLLPRPRAGDPMAAGDLPIDVPDPDLIRDPLSLARALRLLNRRIETGPACLLDVERTVASIAAATAEAMACGTTQAVAWQPVLCQRSEPWLDLALVFDRSPSMCFWERLAHDLSRLLGRHVRFRDLRLWHLEADGGGSPLLRTPGGSVHQPRELLRGDGRTLVLIVSDCSDPAWFNGTMRDVMALWSAALPTGLLQVLPERLWMRTALAGHRAVRVRAASPLQSSDRLPQEPLSRREQELDDTPATFVWPPVPLFPS